MIRRIKKFIFLLLVVSLCLYVVVMNSDPLTIHLSRSWTVSSYAGIVLVVVFFFGAVVAGLASLVVSLRAYWRERRHISQQHQRDAFFEDFVEARNLSSAGDFEKAKEKWEKILRREKDSSAGAIGRVELASLLESKDPKQALKVLDEARSIFPENVEILSHAAKLHESLGNKTAAIDNLALIMYHRPSKIAAEKLRLLSEELGRVEDALEYNRQLERLGGDKKECSDFERRLRFKLLVEQSNPEEKDKLQQDIQVLIREHGDSIDPLLKLGELSEMAGRMDEAAQYLSRAARISKTPLLWHKVVKFWLRHDNPQRAIAAARAASNEGIGEEKIHMNIDLARLYLTLNMPEEALKTIDETLALLSRDNPSWSRLNFLLQVLKGLCLVRLDKHAEADSIWAQLGRYDTANSEISCFAR